MTLPKKLVHLLKCLALSSGLAACATNTTSVLEDNLLEISINELQVAYAEELISAVKLVEFYQARIAELDPQLNSVIELNPDALTIAAELDEERQAGQVRSSMHGVPVLLKDNIDTADRMHTTAGSLALVNAPTPAEDAHLVQRLRAAGAIILGKANLSEWANFRSSSSASGWSARGGQTRNPYILDKSPCGSSSGSGVSVSANLVMVAIGTETDGSVVCPSSINGIVGIKPTLGVVSRSGIIPIAHSQDTAGPMARSVTDAAILLNAMVGIDASDLASVAAGSRVILDYTRFLSRNGLRGKRIGVVRQLFNDSAALNNLLENQLAILEQGGATLVDVEFDNMEVMSDAEYQVLTYEFKADLNAYLENRGGDYQSLASLIAFNIENEELEMPYFGQETFEQAQALGDLSDEAYINALSTAKRLSQADGIDAVMAEYDLDALVAPGNDVAWSIDYENGDNLGSYIASSSLAAISGYPSITVPAGFIDELPIGLLFFAGAFDEPLLIAIAYDYEQRSLARRQPKFLLTNE
ncbi:MAG: amidase [Gammaproteobacteria bacterium]|nr:amidase [Gammaproteobacteria bacterium]MDD9957582.1 amidase [Gammaproteobacteria bacterium]